MSQEITCRANKDAIINVIKKCHDIMYSEEAIVGEKAMHDLMRLLFLRFLEPLIENNTIDIMDEKYYENDIEWNTCSFGKEHLEIVKWSVFYKKSSTNDQLLKNVNMLWKYILNVYPNSKLIFNDDNLNCKVSTLRKLIYEINIISCDIRSISIDIFGEIYEVFINGYQKNGDKLGQFFTNRNYVSIIFKLLDFTVDERKMYKFLDPCAGTGGFTIEAKKHIKNIELHSNEIENTTFSYLNLNMLLNGYSDLSNLKNLNSLHFIEPKEKFNLILTNPPFGTKIKYDDVLSHYADNYCKDILESGESDKKIKDAVLKKFKTVFPYKANKGELLFLQLCMYKLKSGGKCAIVLPDGQILTSTGANLNVRKHLLDKFILEKVLHAPSGTFEHTGIKTCVFFFRKPTKAEKEEAKDEPLTRKVEFWKTSADCKEWALVGSLTYEELESIKFVFSYEKYLSKQDDEKRCQYTPEKFDWKTLGEICDLQIGGTPSRNKAEYWNGDNLWLSVREMNNNIIVDTKEKITNLGVQESNVKLVKTDSVLMSFKLSIGKMAMAGCDLFTNEAIISINTLKPEKLSNTYVYYYLLFNNPESMSSGVFSKGSLNKESIKSIKIPVPPLEKQLEIVKECDEIQKMKEHTLQEIANKDVLIEKIKKFIMPVELRNAEMKTLNTVCRFEGGKALAREKIINGEYPVIGGGKTPTGYHNEFNTEENTILCSSSGTAGYISKYNTKVWKSDCFAIIPLEIVENEYLWYYLKNKQNEIYTYQSGSAQPHVYKKDLANMIIPVPSLEVQEKISDRFEKIYKTRTVLEDSLQKYNVLMNELFNSFIA
jgi:type I restriction-modification system DNA methylase subunit/restriction endonuclease S subunit